MSIHNLVEYGDSYSKISGSFWHYYRDEPFRNADGTIDDFPTDNNSSASFKFQTKIAARTGNDGKKNIKIRVLLKYLSNFWSTSEMQLINCVINLILTRSNRCFIIDNPIADQETAFAITDKKRYVPVVTLSNQDNSNCLKN